jgi:N-acetylglucosamine kinase-like BadF-type ATPase
MEKVIIAVDAGGTKTKICLIDFTKKVLFTHLEGCGSPAAVGEKAFDNIHQGLVVVNDYAKNKYQVVCIAMGISGLGVVKNKKVYEDKYALEFNTKVIIENDAVLALHSIVTDLYDEGVLVLSGTGSAVLGIKNTQTRLMGGWGHLLTESGSSYAVVRDFICQIIRQYETYGTFTELGRKFMEHLNFTKIDEFKVLVYQNSKKDIAKYSKFINEMAEQEHNEEAIALLKQAGRDLANDVKNVVKALNLTANAVIGFRGGFITNVTITQDELMKMLKEYNINITLVSGDNDPVYGAYYMAKRMGFLC